jgi:hypothetical protein
MPRKSLCQEKVPAGPVDVRDRRVPQRVERVEPVEPGLYLPSPKRELNAALVVIHRRAPRATWKVWSSRLSNGWTGSPIGVSSSRSETPPPLFRGEK